MERRIKKLLGGRQEPRNSSMMLLPIAPDLQKKALSRLLRLPTLRVEKQNCMLPLALGVLVTNVYCSE